MAHTHKLIDGVRIDLTAEEIAEIEAREQAWEAGAFNRVMADLRQKRNAKLAETDFHGMSDRTMSAEMTTYRQELRDLTNGVTTKEEAEAVVFPTKP
jgi:hypothetical protein